jgi:hypothetical protein
MVIICAPDMTPEIATKFGAEPCLLVTFGGRRAKPRGGMRVLADIGLANAKRGIDATAYVQFIKRLRPTWAVAPDAFGDFRATLAMWHRYARAISRYAQPIFVVQEFHRQRILNALIDLRQLGVERVALPMRQHPDVSCSREPRLCAERAERAMRVLCGMMSHVHLLGPALRAVRMLRGALEDCERQGTAVSFDTMAYRRAPNSALKRQLSGRWQPRSSAEAEVMLETWLKQALL